MTFPFSDIPIRQLLNDSASVVAFIGLFLALKAYWDSRKQGRVLTEMVRSQNAAVNSMQNLSESQKQLFETQKDQLGSVERIHQSLTTRYLGVHPNYMTTVQDVVSKAEGRLLVMSSVPGFGIYSDPEGWNTLKLLLMQAQERPGFEMQLLTGTKASRLMRLKLQFQAAYDNWNEWIKEESNENKIRKFARMNGRKAPAEVSLEWFEQTLISVNDEIRETVYDGAQRYITDDFLPVIAWIADGRRAVFALSNKKGKFPGFYTEDHQIIQSLEGFADRVMDSALIEA